MTNEVQVFSNPDFGAIRGFLIEGEPWWVGKDVAEALGYKNPQRAVRDHVDEDDRWVTKTVTHPDDAEDRWGSKTDPRPEKMGVTKTVTPSDDEGKGVTKCDAPSVKDALGRDQYPTWINESGLYSLILASKLPNAKKFKRWVTSEVLPALRKTGKYAVKEEEPAPEPPLAEQRQLTSDDYIRAASIIAGCRNERLPIVVSLLEQSGINIPTIRSVTAARPELSPDMVKEEDGSTAALINEAIRRGGLNQARIAEICGLHPTQIMRIRKGQSKPTLERAEAIQKALREALKQTE